MTGQALEGVFDLLVIGGGVNGTAIARDAAGRGLRVMLVEAGDLAQATSSASSKLIHGGLRYLEQAAFGLVRTSLAEREVLLATAPHIVWPMRFVLPHVQGLRPTWLIGGGLWLYDRLASGGRLPASAKVDLFRPPFGEGLRPMSGLGFAYSDCWVDDARLVVLMAVDAAAKGASIRTRTRCLSARRGDGLWHVALGEPDGRRASASARALVNVAGPWVGQVLGEVAGCNSRTRVRLVKGSHMVVPRLYEGAHGFVLQNEDRRIVFVLPYEDAFSLIGTTDVPLARMPERPAIEAGEIDYLCAVVNRYFERRIKPTDLIWSYAGVRPLYDDGRHDPSAVSRECVLELDGAPGLAPLISVFGGKLTTARVTAEQALAKLAPYFPGLGAAWTAVAYLPGGDIGDFDEFFARLVEAHPGLDPAWLRGLARRHGSRARAILAGVTETRDLGSHHGGGLYAREVDWLKRAEWAHQADDVLWRRTKAGLHMSPAERQLFSDAFSG
jgi:D-erythritol 1-phosphate dehydrogenase